MSHEHTPRRAVGHDELTRPLLPYREAIERIVGRFTPLAPSRLPLTDCLDLVLAEDVVATDDIPAFENSAMDGYALRAGDLDGGPGVLRVAPTPAPGAATKVMTGHPMPDGTDAVVPWERVERPDEGTIRVHGSVVAGHHVRRRGEDLTRGTTALRAGTAVDPVVVGVAAMLGRSHLRCHPRPRVGVLSTGDELVGVDEPIGRGLVRDANGPLLGAIAVRHHARVSEHRRTGDDPDAILEALRRLAGVSDLIVSSGGASVGERDWMRVVLEQHGRLDLWRIAMRPGKPVALGELDGVPVVVLPGNPGSVLATGHVVLARALRAMAARPTEPPTVQAELGSDVAGDDERTVLHPVRLRDGVAHPAPARTSQVLSNAVGTDGWLVIAPGGRRAGDRVTVELS